MPVSSDVKKVKASTRLSMPTSFRRGMFSGPNTRSTLTASSAINSPTKPPMSASSTLSVSSCRAIRSRLAPTAARIAISFCRTAARAISRLATLAQAINSTKPTAPNNT